MKEEYEMVNKKIIIQLALATVVGMPLIAVLIDRFSESVSLANSLLGFEKWWLQLAAGLVSGLVIAFIAQWIINTPFMQKVNARYANMLGRFELSLSEIFFISICAGVGEEILFRGAIQPLIGIVLTALVFVAIHGYINPKNWRLSIYGFYMTAAMVGIGYMAAKLGLISAIVAHTIIDVYLLLKLQKWAGSLPVEENASLVDDFEADNNEQEF